jgi:hypothetical protein
MQNHTSIPAAAQTPALTGSCHRSAASSGHVPCISYTVQQVARILNLKRAGNEWHGSNPTGNGATEDGFILFPDGNAWDRKLNQSYTALEVAKLAGIEPGQYEPYFQWMQNKGANGSQSSSASRASTTSPTSATLQASITARPSTSAPASTSARAEIAEHQPSEHQSVEKRSKEKRGQKKLPKATLRTPGATLIHYDYHDGDGALLYQVIRIEAPGHEKGFTQRRPDGTGGWIYNLEGTARVLYNQADVLKAQRVLIPEGEKCADAVNAGLKAEGRYGEIVATTNPQGAGKWLDDYSQTLAHKDTVALRDNDVVGGNHVQKVCRSLQGVAKSIKAVEIPGLPPGGDVADWLLEGGTIAELLRWIDEAPQWNASGKASLQSSGSAADGTLMADTAVEAIDTANAQPYAIRAGRTVVISTKIDRSKQVITNESVVGDFYAYVAEEVISEEGERSLLIRGRTIHARSFEFEVSAECYADDRMLKAALIKAVGAKTGLGANMSKHLMPSIDKFTKEPLQRRRYHRTGWADGKFLIPGREPPGVSIRLPDKLPFAIDPAAHLEKGLACLDALILSQNPIMSTIAVAAAFQAPLAKWANWYNERYAIFIVVRSGGLKTTWTQGLMTLYGPRFQQDPFLIRWDGTTNAIMKLAVHAHDLPFFIDNYKPNIGERGGDGARKCITMIHNILEGGEKDRCNRTNELRDTKPIFCWPFLTGEDVPDSDAAALARVLVIPFVWQRGEDNPKLTEAQRLEAHLCAVGGDWLSWLETKVGQQVAAQVGDRFAARRSIWAATLRQKCPSMANILRVASNLASNELTWEAMAACPSLRPIVERYADTHQRGLEEIAGAMSVRTTESLEAHRYLAAINELVATGQCLLISVDHNVDEQDVDRAIGYRDAHGLYILPTKARERVERLLTSTGGLNGISDTTLHKQLDSLGKIAEKGHNSVTKCKRVQGGSLRVLHLRRGALDAESRGDEATGDEE